MLKEVNVDKHGSNRAQYWKQLEKREGSKWLATRKRECERIDKERRRLDATRRKSVDTQLRELSEELRAAFPERFILHLELKSGIPILTVDAITIEYYPGILSQKKLAFKKPDYFKGVIRALLDE